LNEFPEEKERFVERAKARHAENMAHMRRMMKYERKPKGMK